MSTVQATGLFVDTSVWSLALRRDQVTGPQVDYLSDALARGENVVSTGLVLQELLQGFSRPKAKAAILERFNTLPYLRPDRQDHVAAAALRNDCRRRDVQIGTIDALLAQLCLRYELTMLTSDRDFVHLARCVPLRLWQA